MTATTSNGVDWPDVDQHAALMEGWDVWECFGSASGPFQLQRLEEPGLLEYLGYTEPKFDDDTDAWVHVRTKAAEGSPLHQRALLFIEMNNSLEFVRIMLWPDVQIDTEFDDFDPTDYVIGGPFQSGRCDACGLGLTLNTTHDQDACAAKGPQRNYWEA